MNLTEILNTRVPYDVTKENADAFKTQAEIADRVIIFSASRQDDGTWEVEFAEAPDKHSQATTKLTGSGGEFQVFAMVFASLREFIERYSPERVRFSSSKSEPNRARLYRRLAAKFQDYVVTTTETDKGDALFTMERT